MPNFIIGCDICGTMEDREIRIFLIGTAGAGKSTLARSFRLWMEERGLSAINVNLDPGVTVLDYEPDVDIRDWVSTPEVMEQYGLGPNGAQIASADLAALRFGDVAQAIQEFRSNYIIIDTPGQIELFAFRQASDVFLDTFKTGHNVLVFIMDPSVAGDPGGLVSLFLLSSSIQFRFDAPLFNVLGKADIPSEEELELITSWAETPDLLTDALDFGEAGARHIAANEFMHAIESLQAHGHLVTISAMEHTGLEDLYNLIQQSFFGGEDLRPD